MKSWWARRYQFEHIWLLFVLWVAFITILVVQLIDVLTARAEACLSIDVPPSAVVSQYDGDTFELFTFGSPPTVSIRVLGVNTPELSKKKGVPDQPGSREAKEFTRQWLAKGPFHVSTCGTHTFDRIVAMVDRDGEVLADALIQAGHGKKVAGRL